MSEMHGANEIPPIEWNTPEDKLVAGILGWECPMRSYKCDGTRRTICGACGGNGHGNCYGNGSGPVQINCCSEMPGYSTDPSHVGEMLEYAAAQGLYPVIRAADNRDGSAVVWEVRLADDRGNAWMGESASLSEALARALVAAEGPDAAAAKE